HDVFVFQKPGDAGNAASHDVITDFVQGSDRISLAAIEAVTGGAEDAFHFGGDAAGSLMVAFTTGETIVTGDIDGDGTADFQFAPAYNWPKMLSDERVWNAVSNTLIYTGVALVFEVVLGLLIALLLDSDRKGYGLLRALMTLPLVMPPAVTGMMFLLMLDGSFGVLSRSLYALGLLSPQYPILANASTALAGVLLADIWQWTPFMVLIMLAGLRSLPKEPFEAAAIDGASSIQ